MVSTDAMDKKKPGGFGRVFLLIAMVINAIGSPPGRSPVDECSKTMQCRA